MPRLGLLYFPERKRTFNDEGAFLNVPPLKSKSLARAKAGISEQRDEYRVAEAVAAQKRDADRLDASRTNRPHHALSALRRLLDCRNRIGLNTTPDHSAPENSLEKRKRLQDRRIADPGCSELGLEALHDLRGYLAKLDSAEPREHVAIPDACIDLTRLPRKVLLAVHLPPLSRKVCERLAPRVEKLEISEAPPTAKLCIERFGIALSVEVA